VSQRLSWTSQAKSQLRGLSTTDRPKADDLIDRFERTGNPKPTSNSSAPGTLEIYEAPILIRVVLDAAAGELRVKEVITESE
jgi:hypothetical protein